MTRTVQRIVLAAGVVVGLGVAIYLVRQLIAEPLHKGKPLSYWVDRACSDSEAARPFRDEVKRIGAAAVPRLMRHLQASDRWRKPYRWFRANLPNPWQRLFPDVPSAVELHRGAATTLGLLGADAKPAVPDLIRLLPESSRGGYFALDTLRSIGPDASCGLRCSFVDSFRVFRVCQRNGFDRNPGCMLTGFNDILGEIACIQNQKAVREPCGCLPEGNLSRLEGSWRESMKRFALAGTEPTGTNPRG
jgi:hypothetical protein